MMDQLHVRLQADTAGFSLGITLLDGEWSRWHQPEDQDTLNVEAVTALARPSGRGSASVVVTLVQPCVMALCCICRNCFLRTGTVK